MYRYVKSSTETDQDCASAVAESIAQGIEADEYANYDDVISDVYAGIQSYFDELELSLSDEAEDRIFDAVFESLSEQGYVDTDKGLIIYR